MIENLVAMARIERGGEFGGVRPVLLERIIKQLVEREKALWPEVTINLASNGPVQMVAADEEYLAQIMRNLLSNAAKYSGAGSTVEVSLEDTEGEVLIRVRDNGPGIAEDDADRLFGLYYRSAQQATTAPGAGIGLFVCRELVAAMGGRIWAESRPEGGSSSGSASRPTSTSSISPRRRHGPCLRSRADHRRTRIRRWRRRPCPPRTRSRPPPDAAGGLDRSNLAVKCRSAGGWSTIRNPRSEAARSATQRTTSMT